MNTIKILIILLLCIVPFLIIPEMDTREPKMFFAVTGAAGVILSAFYFGYFKPVKNKWLLIFLAYIPLCILLSPKLNVVVANTQIANFYVWKAALYLTIFALFIHSIYSIDFSFKDKQLFLKIMFWCGFVMSCYVGLQYLNLDQFFTSGGGYGRLGGTLGNPDIVSIFIAVIIPLALYFKKYIHAIFMAITVFLTDSYTAYGALIAALLFLAAIKNKVCFGIVSTFLIMIFILGFAVYKTNNVLFHKIVADHGRFNVVKNVINDMKQPKNLPFTGTGPGSFPYLYHIKHSNPGEEFDKAHNEYIELLFDMGLAGVFILLAGIGSIIKNNITFVKQYRYCKYLLASFICVCISAGGIFVWHIGPLIIYSCVITGLLMKPNQEENHETCFC